MPRVVFQSQSEDYPILVRSNREVQRFGHVEEMKERIVVKVEVLPIGGGRSTVQIMTA